MVSAMTGKAKIINVLVKSGAKIANVDSRGSSALHYACQSSKIRAIKELLDLGAEVSTKNKKGQMPEDVC